MIVASYPIVITDRTRECRNFYTRWFGFELVFEANWIVVLSGTGGDVPGLAFMHSSHPSSPPEPAPYRGEGVFMTLQVEDAASRRSTQPGCGSTWWSRSTRPSAGGIATSEPGTRGTVGPLP